jgi:hypothetical protein
MPTPALKSLADKAGISMDKAEKYWEKAKQLASEEGHEEEYDYITGIVKKMMGISESKLADSIIFSVSETLSEKASSDKIKKLEAEVKKLHLAKQNAYAKWVDAKEKYGSSDAFYNNDIVLYQKLRNEHDEANAAWDKAYFKLKKMKEKSVAESNISEGHDTIMFFAKTPDFNKAMKLLSEKTKQDKEDYGNQEGYWTSVAGEPEKSSQEFDSLKDAQNYAYQNVYDYAFVALKVKNPEGWLFAADVHI